MTSRPHQSNDDSLLEDPNSYWFVDFALLDITIVDTNGSVIESPYLTTVSDVKSKLCMGYFLSLKPPNYEEIIQNLREASFGQ